MGDVPDGAQPPHPELSQFCALPFASSFAHSLRWLGVGGTYNAWRPRADIADRSPRRMPSARMREASCRPLGWRATHANMTLPSARSPGSQGCMGTAIGSTHAGEVLGSVPEHPRRELRKVAPLVGYDEDGTQNVIWRRLSWSFAKSGPRSCSWLAGGVGVLWYSAPRSRSAHCKKGGRRYVALVPQGGNGQEVRKSCT